MLMLHVEFVIVFMMCATSALFKWLFWEKRCLMWFNGRYMLTLFVNMKVLVENDLVCSMESSSACNYALGLFEYPRHVEAQCTQCGPLSRMVS